MPETFVPNFPHRHYHSYGVNNRRMVDVNPNLRVRAEDVAHVANRLGARSIMDVGSNLGGFLFFLEQFTQRTELLGVEGDARFVAECQKVASLLESKVQFRNKDIMALEPTTVHDAMILQNVYHYIFDKKGSHEPIFKQFARHARSIIWYNPMNDSDPVIPQHANSNPNADWSSYNHGAIFKAAMKAGFLHPLPLKLRFAGMGPAREHWLFVRDEVRPLCPSVVPLSEIGTTEIAVRDHFKNIHKVTADDRYFYKVFLTNQHHQMDRLKSAVESGFFDRTICEGLCYIVDQDGKPVGYRQPRSTEAKFAREALGTTVDRDFRRMLWILFSRMVRLDRFNHDVGRHNLVFDLASSKPMMIDLENVIDSASSRQRLSIYRVAPNENEVKSAEANLQLFFPDITVTIADRDPITVLCDCLARSTFVSTVDYTNML